MTSKCLTTSPKYHPQLPKPYHTLDEFIQYNTETKSSLGLNIQFHERIISEQLPKVLQPKVLPIQPPSPEISPVTSPVVQKDTGKFVIYHSKNTENACGFLRILLRNQTPEFRLLDNDNDTHMFRFKNLIVPPSQYSKMRMISIDGSTVKYDEKAFALEICGKNKTATLVAQCLDILLHDGGKLKIHKATKDNIDINKNENFTKLEDRKDKLPEWIAEQWKQQHPDCGEPSWSIFKTTDLQKSLKFVKEFDLKSKFKSRRNQGVVWSNYYVIAQKIVDEMLNKGLYSKRKNCPYKPVKMNRTKDIVRFVCEHISILLEQM